MLVLRTCLCILAKGLDLVKFYVDVKLDVRFKVDVKSKSEVEFKLDVKKRLDVEFKQM
jgi:hypothetical protein